MLNLQNFIFTIFSRTKKKQYISMCLVHSWKTGFSALRITALLLQYNLIDKGTMNLSSSIKFLIQTNSHIALAIDQSSNTMLDWNTTCYFLLFHAIKLAPTNMQHPIIDLLYTGACSISIRKDNNSTLPQYEHISLLPNAPSK